MVWLVNLRAIKIQYSRWILRLGFIMNLVFIRNGKDLLITSFFSISDASKNDANFPSGKSLSSQNLDSLVSRCFFFLFIYFLYRSKFMIFKFVRACAILLMCVWVSGERDDLSSGSLTRDWARSCELRGALIGWSCY